VYIPVDAWFRAFVLTLVVEIPIAARLLRRWEPSSPRLIALVFFANVASHPIVWFVFTQVLLIGTLPYLAVVEAWAVSVEAMYFWAALRGVPVRWAAVTSLVANTASFVVGWILTAVWPVLTW
jgi:hypothetical protein